MVKFTEEVVPGKFDVMFVKEDPARVYRGFKDMMVDEFDIDRIEEGHMEFNVSRPKDTIRINAYKEKSPHTVLQFRFSMRAKDPRVLYQKDRPENIMKVRIKASSNVLTVYPGGNPVSWLPKTESEWPENRHGTDITGLEAEKKTAFQRSKLYKILAGIWYRKFYSKEIARYEEEAEEITLRAVNLLRERFGVEEAIWRTGSSQYQPPWR